MTAATAYPTILPSPATALEIALDQTGAARLDLPVQVLETLWSADDCPVAFLDFLALTLSVDVWDRSWDEGRKRSVILSSVYQHRHKGTAAGMRRALNALGFDMQVEEWFNYNGEPYSFRVNVHVNAEPLTATTLSLIHETIDQSKPVRAWLDLLKVFLSARVQYSTAIVAKSGIRQMAVPQTPRADLKRVTAVVGVSIIKQRAGAAS